MMIAPTDRSEDRMYVYTKDVNVLGLHGAIVAAAGRRERSQRSIAAIGRGSPRANSA